MMPDENSTLEENAVPEKIDKKGIFHMVVYKLDRNLAIAGIIVLGLTAILVKSINSTAAQIATTAIGALAVYIGGRGKKEAT